MGFSMNPIRTPVMFDLAGTVQGSARLAWAGEAIDASGVITPTGYSRVSGTLYFAGNAEWGTLKLDSRASHLKLSVFGTAGKPLQFTINGTTVVPHSHADFGVVDGSGVVTVVNTIGPKGPLISLKFTG